MENEQIPPMGNMQPPPMGGGQPPTMGGGPPPPMGDGENPFLKFILERTRDDKKDEMSEFLKEAFKPPEEPGAFDPESFKRNNEIIISMLTPEGAEEMHKMMNPFGDLGDYDETLEDKNWLAQPNKLKWKDNTPEVSADEMRAAFACSKRADDMKCECWNSHCQFYGNCRKCIVFHLALKQFPTCQRFHLGELEDHYIAFSQDK